MDERWLKNVLTMIPPKLKASANPQSVSQLAAEMREDYSMSVKKAIGISPLSAQQTILSGLCLERPTRSF